MIKYYQLVLANLIGVLCFAQSFENPFDANRNAFNQRDIISVYKQPNLQVQQQILAYDWIEAFNQNAWQNLEERSGGPTELTPNSSGYIVVETANFNNNEKDDVFYMNEHQGRWNYAASEQIEILNEDDSIYDFVLETPDFADGAEIAGNHSHPALTIGDFDGDGTDEAAIAWTEGNNRDLFLQVIDITEESGILSCNPITVYATGEVSESTSPNSYNSISITAGDFNGDGTDEVAVAGLNDNITDDDMQYDAYIKFFDFSEDGALSIIDGGKEIFDDSSLLFDITQGDDASLSYIRTAIEAVRPYPTDEIDGGQETVFAALGYDYNGVGNNFDYDFLKSYHIEPSSDLESSTVSEGESISTQTFEWQASQSPFESKRGELSNDLTDDIVILLDRFVIFTFEDGEIVVGNNGAQGGANPILDFSNNPYAESVDRFDLGDINRDGIDDIVCQTKQFNGGGQGVHQYFVQTFQTSIDENPGEPNSLSITQTGFFNFEYESGMSQSNYGFAMGNLDGNDLCLGDPIEYTCDYYKPIVILEAVPNHFDVVDGEELDINDCYALNAPNECNNLVSFQMSNSGGQSSSVEVSSDWSVEAEASFGGIPGLGIGGSLGYKYGEQFSNITAEETEISVSIDYNAVQDDLMSYRSMPFTMIEYPVLDALGDTATWIVAAFPSNEGFNDFGFGKELLNYLPNHEPGNILSYPKPDSEDFAYDKSEDGNWEIYQFEDPISVGTGGSANVEFVELVGSSVTNSSTQTQTISASVGVNGLGLGISTRGEYTESETKVFGQNLGQAESYVVDPDQIISNSWGYSIFPKLYWTKDRATKLAMSVDLSQGGALWQEVYGQQVDPALNMPYKFEELHDPFYIESNLDRTKSVYFDKINPNPGDTVTAFIKVFNYSLMSMNEPVPFSVYNGHPDLGGEIIEDLDGNTLFETSEILEDQGRSVQSVSFVVTPDMIGNGSVQIYFELDPNNEIDEIHENNNLGWTNLGYVCNSPGGVLSVGDFAIADKKFEFRLFPNPGSSTVSIDFKDALNYINDNVVLSIYNLSGQLQEQIKVGNKTNAAFSFDISHLANGSYIIQVHTPTEVIFNSKLVVIK